MVAKIRYASFLIRLWCTSDSPDSSSDGWLSEVQHIQSGRSWNFYSLHALVDFLNLRLDNRSEFPWIEIVDQEE